MCDRMRIALASCLIWMMLCAEKAQTNCPRTNRRASRMCARSCSPETSCGNPTDECLCDGDCGYSCVGKGLSCGKPPSVRKAQPQYQSTNFRAVVTYVCNTGYTLSGASQRTCRGIGKWDDVGPKCLAMCSTPVIPFSTYIAKPLNYSGSYSTGETITLACKKGFKERPGGNPVRICISGRWTQFPFKCIGTHSCRRTIRPAQTKCTQECSPESGCGSDRYSCLCDGRCGYSCIEKGMSCGEPLTIANGKLNFTGTGYNDTAHYTCDKGYSLNTDSPVKRCTAKKQWDGLPARCIQDCVKPKVPRNAIISNPSESYRSGDKVTFECKEGFNQEGIATQMCFQGGWTVLPFKCSGDCESELGMKNKQISDDSITASSHYQNNFPHLARVDSNSGAWCSDPTDVAPYIQMDLKEEKIITGVDTQGSFRPMRWVEKFKIKYLVQNNWTTYGDSEGSDKVFEGNKGTSLTEPNVLKPPLRTQKIRIYPYQSQGDPSLNNVACLRLELKGCTLPDCGDPGTPLNGRKLGVTYSLNSKVNFNCDLGYELWGSEERKCQQNGTWTGQQPVCKGVDCGRLLPPTNGSLVGEETTFSSHVEIRCDKGFILRGSQRRTCQANRTWSGTTASCQVDGGFGEWGDWSECSLTCGIGKQRRMRKCDSPKPQNGGRQCDMKEYVHERYCRKRKCGGNLPGYSGSGEGWDLYSGLEKDTDQSAIGADDEWEEYSGISQTEYVKDRNY